jgi:hypothetical protein
MFLKHLMMQGGHMNGAMQTQLSESSLSGRSLGRCVGAWVVLPVTPPLICAILRRTAAHAAKQRLQGGGKVGRPVFVLRQRNLPQVRSRELPTCCRRLRCSWMTNHPLPSSRVSLVLNLTNAPLPDQSPGTGLGSVDAITCQ